MYLCNEKYTVEIKSVPSFHDMEFNVILNPKHYVLDELTKILVLRISSSEDSLTLGIIVSYLTQEINCASLEGNILTILANDSILRFNLLTKDLTQFVEVPGFDCGISIHRVEDGYILYGEMEIIMITNDLEVKWRYSGRDIFITIDGSCAFELKKDAIYLRDFEGNQYVVSYEGTTINYVTNSGDKV